MSSDSSEWSSADDDASGGQGPDVPNQDNQRRPDQTEINKILRVHGGALRTHKRMLSLSLASRDRPPSFESPSRWGTARDHAVYRQTWLPFVQDLRDERLFSFPAGDVAQPYTGKTIELQQIQLLKCTIQQMQLALMVAVGECREAIQKWNNEVCCGLHTDSLSFSNELKPTLTAICTGYTEQIYRLVVARMASVRNYERQLVLTMTSLRDTNRLPEAIISARCNAGKAPNIKLRLLLMRLFAEADTSNTLLEPVRSWVKEWREAAAPEGPPPPAPRASITGGGGPSGDVQAEKDDGDKEAEKDDGDKQPCCLNREAAYNTKFFIEPMLQVAANRKLGTGALIELSKYRRIIGGKVFDDAARWMSSNQMDVASLRNWHGEQLIGQEWNIAGLSKIENPVIAAFVARVANLAPMCSMVLWDMFVEPLAASATKHLAENTSLVTAWNKFRRAVGVITFDTASLILRAQFPSANWVGDCLQDDDFTKILDYIMTAPGLKRFRDEVGKLVAARYDPMSDNVRVAVGKRGREDSEVGLGFAILRSRPAIVSDVNARITHERVQRELSHFSDFSAHCCSAKADAATIQRIANKRSANTRKLERDILKLKARAMQVETALAKIKERRDDLRKEIVKYADILHAKLVPTMPKNDSTMEAAEKFIDAIENVANVQLSKTPNDGDLAGVVAKLTQARTRYNHTENSDGWKVFTGIVALQHEALQIQNDLAKAELEYTWSKEQDDKLSNSSTRMEGIEHRQNKIATFFLSDDAIRGVSEVQLQDDACDFDIREYVSKRTTEMETLETSKQRLDRIEMENAIMHSAPLREMWFFSFAVGAAHLEVTTDGYVIQIGRRGGVRSGDTELDNVSFLKRK